VADPLPHGAELCCQPPAAAAAAAAAVAAAAAAAAAAATFGCAGCLFSFDYESFCSNLKSRV